MYGRLLLESLRRGTRRKLLAVSAVALGTLGATALGEVMLASGDRLAAEIDVFEHEIALKKQGKIEIEYYGEADLQRILGLLGLGNED